MDPSGDGVRESILKAHSEDTRIDIVENSSSDGAVLVEWNHLTVSDRRDTLSENVEGYFEFPELLASTKKKLLATAR